MAIPLLDISSLEEVDVWMCQNLVDYSQKVLNPSIRDDFISARFYSMTFSPMREETLNNLIPSDQLKYMPTYESTAIRNYIQTFVSQFFANSLITSFTRDGRLDILLAQKQKSFDDKVKWDTIAKFLFKGTSQAQGWVFTLYLSK